MWLGPIGSVKFLVNYVAWELVIIEQIIHDIFSIEKKGRKTTKKEEEFKEDFSAPCTQLAIENEPCSSQVIPHPKTKKGAERMGHQER